MPEDPVLWSVRAAGPTCQSPWSRDGPASDTAGRGLWQVLARAGYVSHQVGKWHIGFFDRDHLPVGRGFASSFGFMLGASSHDNRSSCGSWSVTCGTCVRI